MEWWVEVTSLDGQSPPAELSLEAPSPGEALREVRAARSERGELSWELLEALDAAPQAPRRSPGPAGVRAFDLAAGLRYLVLPGPADAAHARLLGTGSCQEPPPSYEVVVSRDGEPTTELPLVYRERGVRIASHASMDAALRLLWELLEEQVRGLAGYSRGRVIELAVFAGVVEHGGQRSPAGGLPPPLVSLSFRDWRGVAEVRRAGAARVESWPVPAAWGWAE